MGKNEIAYVEDVEHRFGRAGIETMILSVSETTLRDGQHAKLREQQRKDTYASSLHESIYAKRLQKQVV